MKYVKIEGVSATNCFASQLFRQIMTNERYGCFAHALSTGCCGCFIGSVTEQITPRMSALAY